MNVTLAFPTTPHLFIEKKKKTKARSPFELSDLQYIVGESKVWTELKKELNFSVQTKIAQQNLGITGVAMKQITFAISS